MTDPGERFVHPTTAQEVLQATFQAASPENAETVLTSFRRYGFDLIRTDLLERDQHARLAALSAARGIVAPRIALVGQVRADVGVSDLFRAARFILTGDEFYGVPDDDVVDAAVIDDNADDQPVTR